MITFQTYFNNYDGFKAEFVTREGNRHNGVVLSYLKWCFRHRNDSILLPFVRQALRMKYNMQDVYDSVLYLMFRVSSQTHMADPSARLFKTEFLGLQNPVWHSTIESDYRKGVCEDNDIDQIRFIRHLTPKQMEHTNGEDRARVVKKRAGRLLREIVTEWLPDLPESVLNYVCETFASKWRADRISDVPRYTLHINGDFELIYSGDDDENLIEGSCMAGEDQYSFYENYVNASAAYLTDNEDDDKVVARCVIFNKVYDRDGNVYRYAERQYSKGGDLTLKQLLIDMLIDGGHIDIYKEVGCSYSDIQRIYRVSDRTLLDNRFNLYIENSITSGDTMSFQDTFIYLRDGHAYNSEPSSYEGRLDRTDCRFQCYEYDEYHDDYCEEVCTVHVWVSYRGYYREMTCDVNNLDDFNRDEYNDELYDDGVWIGDEFYNYESDQIANIDGVYHHIDDVKYSEYYNEWILEDDAVYSEIERDWIRKDDAIKIGGKWYIKEKCASVPEEEAVIEDGVIYMAY